jgi:hypothetical protein
MLPLVLRLLQNFLRLLHILLLLAPPNLNFPIHLVQSVPRHPRYSTTATMMMATTATTTIVTTTSPQGGGMYQGHIPPAPRQRPRMHCPRWLRPKPRSRTRPRFPVVCPRPHLWPRPSRPWEIGIPARVPHLASMGSRTCLRARSIPRPRLIP